MRFKARIGSEYKNVDVVFGDESDVRNIGRWRAPKDASSAVRDAIEFARLASKRWRYYRRSIPCVRTLAEFQSIAKPENRGESCLILIAKADWFISSQPLGLAQCRRTFCNHLILEFLSVHPKVIVGAEPRVRGIGSGLIYTLAALANAVQIGRLWGEATEHSAPFYKHIFETEGLTDQFTADAGVLKRCSLRFKSDVFGELEI
jgi:hypothetical protein